MRFSTSCTAAALLGVAAIVGCSGGGGGGSSSSSGGGTTQTAVFVKDVPAPLTDGKVMVNLFLRVTAVELRDPTTAIPLSPPGTAFVDFDLLALDQTATLLALGNVPAGVFEELRFTLDQQNCSFVDSNGVRFQLQVPDPVFEVEFSPPIDTSVNSTIFLDIRPGEIVKVVTPNTTYRLEDDVDALVVGPPGSNPALPSTIVVDDVEGDITSISCATSQFTLNSAIVVNIAAAAIEDENGVALTCAQLLVGDEVEVEGTLTVNGNTITIVATTVEVDRQTGGGGGGSGSGSGSIEIDGVIANLQKTANPPTFDVVRGATVIARVTVQAGTEIEDEPTDTDITVMQLNNGDVVEVEGPVAAAGPPPTIDADEIERQ
jgi:hypothetical protein